MIQRILLFLLLISLLVGLIAYSQFRPQPRKASGFIEADEIRLGSRLGGRVKTVLVEEGQPVVRGQKLVELEPFDLLERELEARQTLAAREAEYQRLTAGLRPEEIAQAEARYTQLMARAELLEAGPREQEKEAGRGRLKVAEAERKLAQENLKRIEKLAGTDAVTREQLDQAIEKIEAAEAMVAVREQELSLLVAGTREEEKREALAKVEEARQAWELAKLGFRAEEREQARAARDAAQAAVEALGRQVAELVISSPVDGTVEALELQPGDLVAANAPVLSILDRQRLWVRAYVPEDRLNFSVGQRLWITVDSFPGEVFDGEVSFLSRQAEFTPSNIQTPEERSKQVFRIKVDLKTGKEKLHPGMAADVWWEAPTKLKSE